MKLTDLTIVYIVILLPIVITLMVNTSLLVTSQKHELYTKTIISSSVRDAVDSMKQIENTESKGDYGYSNDIVGRISVDPHIGVNTFFNSMLFNLGAISDGYTSNSLRQYVPAIAIMDYDGMYIYSVDNVVDGGLQYTIKPKTYFSYSYCIVKDGVPSNPTFSVKGISELTDADKIYGNLVYNVKFTQDNYIYLDIYQMTTGGMIKLQDVSTIQNYSLELYNSEFYFDDDKNNTWLVGERYLLWLLDGGEGLGYLLQENAYKNDFQSLLNEVKVRLADVKAKVITETCQNQIKSAVANHNEVCRSLGINYEFKYEPDMSENWYEENKGVGIIVVVQGMKTGKSYINYTLSNISTVGISKKYYLSEAVENPKPVIYRDDQNVIRLDIGLNDYFVNDPDYSDVPIDSGDIEEEEIKKIKSYTENVMYYHADEHCPLYKAYKEYDPTDKTTLAPAFFYSEAECVANGFVECPICKP